MKYYYIRRDPQEIKVYRGANINLELEHVATFKAERDASSYINMMNGTGDASATSQSVEA